MRGGTSTVVPPKLKKSTAGITEGIHSRDPYVPVVPPKLRRCLIRRQLVSLRSAVGAKRGSGQLSTGTRSQAIALYIPVASDASWFSA